MPQNRDEVAERRAMLEAQYDEEAEREGGAISHRRIYEVRRPRKRSGHCPPAAKQVRLGDI
jgi:hypothetical protein